MPDVLVTWTTQMVQHPAGSPAPDHFVIGLATTEVNEPLTSTQHLFQNIAPGSYEGTGAVVAADGTELQTPVTYSVTVPEQPPVNVPIIVSLSGTAQ